MKEELIIAGFGGQGVLSMGKILAYAALMDNLEVTPEQVANLVKYGDTDKINKNNYKNYNQHKIQ